MILNNKRLEDFLQHYKANLKNTSDKGLIYHICSIRTYVHKYVDIIIARFLDRNTKKIEF